MGLIVSVIEGDHKLLVNQKSFLQRSFKLTSYKAVDRAVILAVYLVSLKRYEEAKNLLDQFVFKVVFDPGRLDLWVSNGYGLVIRAYIAEFQQDTETQLSCIRLIQHNDIISDERDKEEMLLEDLDSYTQELEYILGETPKWKCEGMAISAMIMTHYKLMMDAGAYDIKSVDVKELKKTIDYCYDTLRETLN